MPGAEHVEAALRAPQESARSVFLADSRERLAAARQHLVSVRLMSDVPDQPIRGRIEHVVQRDGEFDGAEAAGEMSAARRATRNQLVAQRRRRFRQRLAGQTPKVSRFANRVEQRHTPRALSIDAATVTLVTGCGKGFR